MMQAMGVPFAFDTTQGAHVEDERANVSGVKVKSTRSARQFMNRRGGFNRPLPAERTGEKVARD
jgi:U4/U6.U5 tri-snRNP-associated protein 3